MEDGTTRAKLDPDTGERLVALRRELSVSSFGLNQLVLRPGQRGRIHRHERQEEVYVVLEGTLTLALEGEKTDLGEGELIRVALRRELSVSSFGLNQLVLRPGQRGRIHRHERQEEVYVVLEGTLTLALEGEKTDLGEGELIRVAPRLRRQLINRGPGRLVLLALGGEGEHNGRDGEAFASWKDAVGAPPREIPLPGDLDDSELRD